MSQVKSIFLEPPGISSDTQSTWHKAGTAHMVAAWLIFLRYVYA